MKTQNNPTQENKSIAAANEEIQDYQSSHSSKFTHSGVSSPTDETGFHTIVNNSPRVLQLNAFQEMANNSPQAKQAAQFHKIANSNNTNVLNPQSLGGVIQRADGPEGADGEEAGGGEGNNVLEAVGDAATVVSAITGDSSVGEAMETLAEFAEGAGGAQEALTTAEVLPKILGGGKALNTVASFAGKNIPFLGTAISSVELAQSALQTVPEARAEVNAAQEDVDQPDLEMGRTQEEREERLSAAIEAQNEAMAEMAGQAGGLSGVPLMDKAASLATTAVTEGPQAAAEQLTTGVTNTAYTLANATRATLGYAYSGAMDWFQKRLQAQEEQDYTNQLDLMEQGLLNK